MRSALLAWFDEAARPLPWRDGRVDAYRSLVVETMSQQTRIATVVARLPGFLARFPDLAALAAAPLDDVLAAWAGLGYYRRAGALHRLARTVVAEHGGALPTSVEALRSLPGVGPYTATALAAHAFGVPGVAVDGNVRRVGARLLAEPNPTDERVRTYLTARLLTDDHDQGDEAGRHRRAAHVDADSRRRAATVAEALVELGATVCTPRTPDCPACPLQAGCRASRSDDPTRFPVARPRSPVRPWTLHGWLVVRAGPSATPRVALERRPDGGPWGGLHGLPWRAEPPGTGSVVATFVHALTHRRVEATVWRTNATPHDAAVRWVDVDDLAGLGVAEIDRRALAVGAPLAGPAPAA